MYAIRIESVRCEIEVVRSHIRSNPVSDRIRAGEEIGEEIDLSTCIAYEVRAWKERGV